jgi:transcriptional regulator with XRE-family HTH domain
MEHGGQQAIRGYRLHNLLRDLALKELTAAQLADKYGVSTATIDNYRKRFAIEVREIQEHFEDDLAGLWIAKKRNRIAEYQKKYEDLDELVGDEGQGAIALQSRILRWVAEELGQLPQKVHLQASVDPVRVEVIGVNTEDLT